jgi:hypothetical protein
MLTLFDGETYRLRNGLYREVSRDERQVRYQFKLVDAPTWSDRQCDLDLWLNFIGAPDVRSV